LSPTFGFIVSYVIAVFVVGKIVEKNRSFSGFITAAMVGLVINYVFGTNWMYAAYKLWAAAPEGFTYQMAWSWMVVPMPKDIILTALAAILAFRLEKTVLSKGSFKHLKRTA
jgi:biotin transport system substrate-specific component